MSDKKIPFVSYYSENKISPVSQDISDLNKHFRRRDALYRHLGIPSAFIEGKKVLEVGPGSGHNALFTLHCRPSAYTLIEGNKIGAEQTQCRLNEYARQHMIDTEINVQHKILQDFVHLPEYDLVICEGMLPGQEDSVGMLRQIMGYAKPGGVVCITCIDELSSLSDILRRAMGQAVTDMSLPLLEQAKLLEPFFESHFVNLRSMSRPVYDWILDNVLHPYTVDAFPVFSISSAVDAATDLADAYLSSPRFLTDWRWYKDINQCESGENELAKKLYWENVHNFIDYEALFEVRDINSNMLLLEKAKEISVLASSSHLKAPPHSGKLVAIAEVVDSIAEDVSRFNTRSGSSALTAARLRDGMRMLREIHESKTPLKVKPKEFAHFFGKGTQYITFIRK